MEPKFKIEEQYISKYNEIIKLQSEFYDYLQDVGKATVLGYMSFMLDEKFDEKEIREYITKFLNTMHSDAIAHYNEIKTKLYK